MALNSMCAIAWMKAARPSGVPKPRRGSSRGCTRRGRGGRPGMAMGAGGGAPASSASSPRAKAAAASKVAATLSSGEAASRQARAAANSEVVTSRLAWERLQPPPPLPSQGREPKARGCSPTGFATIATNAGSRRQAALALGLVRAQLPQAVEVVRFDAGHVLAAEAGAVEAATRELGPGDRGFQVGQVLV